MHSIFETHLNPDVKADVDDVTLMLVQAGEQFGYLASNVVEFDETVKCSFTFDPTLCQLEILADVNNEKIHAVIYPDDNTVRWRVTSALFTNSAKEVRKLILKHLFTTSPVTLNNLLAVLNEVLEDVDDSFLELPEFVNMK